MRALRFAASLAALFLLALPTVARAAPPPQSVEALALLSEETEGCLGCHQAYTPGIVADWRASRHAHITPTRAMRKPVLERRISTGQVPAPLQKVAVGCYECHGLNPGAHKDNFEHNGYRINVVVSPEDCKTCHPVEVAQYALSKKAAAIDNLERNPVYHALVDTVTGNQTLHQGRLVGQKPSEATKARTCLACHGTRVTVAGMKTVTRDGDDYEVPKLLNWPNQGVGRQNPDGSFGACTACHTRHAFSIAVARQPFTCAQCHLAPDVPAWNVFRESKHGNLTLSLQNETNWDAVPWRVGRDFRAPTCALCHASLLTNPDGEPLADRNHDFGGRLWVRIFGLIYSHPQPMTGATYDIRNADGLPLPTTFAGAPATKFLIDAEEQARRKDLMRQVCLGCHGTDWADGLFAQLDSAVVETDAMVRLATQLVQQAWDAKLADPANPFDEPLERLWVQQWLFYANSVRYAAAMGGPDYATFKDGWWELTRNPLEMQEKLGELRAMHAGQH